MSQLDVDRHTDASWHLMSIGILTRDITIDTGAHVIWCVLQCVYRLGVSVCPRQLLQNAPENVSHRGYAPTAAIHLQEK